MTRPTARHEELRRYLAQLLAGAPGDPDVSPESLAARADAEGVAGLLLDLSALSRPGFEEQRSAVQAIAREGAVREMAGLAETRRILSMFQQAGIELLVLKGSALAYWLYREPWHRTRCDLDILVKDKEAAWEAVRILRAEGYGLLAGVDPDIADGYEVALQRGSGVVIDLHWKLLNTAVLGDRLTYGELGAEARRLPSLHPHARGLGATHALAHALLHRVTNMAKGDGNRLIWMHDIHLLANAHDPVAWQGFVELCRSREIATPSLDGLRASRDMLATRLPGEVETELAALAESESWHLGSIDQGAIDRSNLAALPWPEKLPWLRRKLMPSPEFMRYRYGVSGRGGLFAAYAWRWWTGIRRALGARVE